MKVEESNIKKLLIKEVVGVDPISVFLEDIAPREGKITIECWGKSWSAYWGGMGKRTIAEFFVSCNPCYLITNLTRGLDFEKYEPDWETYKTEMRQKVCEMRRSGDISHSLAREMFEVEEWQYCATENPYEPIRYDLFFNEQELRDIDFQGFDVPERITTEYRYLTHIVETVQKALK